VQAPWWISEPGAIPQAATCQFATAYPLSVPASNLRGARRRLLIFACLGALGLGFMLALTALLVLCLSPDASAQRLAKVPKATTHGRGARGLLQG
jgi:hypothetical protein